MGISPAVKLTRRHVVAALSVLAVALVVMFVWQAWSAYRALDSARDEAGKVQELIRDADFDGANRELAALADHAEQAHDSTDGVLWDLTKHVPFVGRNIGAVQTVSEVLDTATRINAPIALKLSEELRNGGFKPTQGRIDLARILTLTPSVRTAATSIDEAARDLDRIRSRSLLFPFNDMVGELQDKVDDARSAANATSTAFDLLPQMLGKDGPRDYLLMIQNPAELRSTGGLAGSLAILHAEDGRLTMGWQGSAADINPFAGPVVKLPKDTLQAYGPTIASDFRDVNFTPDFPEAAQIARTMVKQKEGTDVDGVLSIDPVALGMLMRGTGSVPVGAVTLTADTVVPTLLNAVYKNVQNPGEQDAFFEDAARKIFDSVMTGQGNQQLAIRGLGEAAGQHRVLLWSADAAEQARLQPTAVGGALLGRTGDQAQLGAYLNDSTAGKMDYYLEYRSAASAVDCRKSGAQDIRVAMTFTSTMPKDYASLGPYVLGTGEFAKQGTIAFNLRFYGAEGGEITGMKVDGAPRSVTADEHHDRQVAFLPISLKPGQTVNVIIDARTDTHQAGDAIFSFTPGLEIAPNGVRVATACD